MSVPYALISMYFRLIDINARRPSLRTDLLLNRAKTTHLNRTPSLSTGSSSVAAAASIAARNGSIKNDKKSKRSTSSITTPNTLTSQQQQQSNHSTTSETNRLIRQVRNNCVIS